MVLAVLVMISPPGREIIRDAFFAREALSQGIAEFLLYIGLGIVVLLGGLEWLVRLIISRRHARGATTSA